MWFSLGKWANIHQFKVLEFKIMKFPNCWEKLSQTKNLLVSFSKLVLVSSVLVDTQWSGISIYIFTILVSGEAADPLTPLSSFSNLNTYRIENTLDWLWYRERVFIKILVTSNAVVQCTPDVEDCKTRNQFLLWHLLSCQVQTPTKCSLFQKITRQVWTCPLYVMEWKQT